MNDDTWDCIVVGGGAAGLSAALVLGRARRTTLVLDTGAPSNLVAHGIGGQLGWDGRPPASLYAAGRDELARYPSVEVRSAEVVGGEPGFSLTLDGGSVVRARTVLLAMGMDYGQPSLPGLAERWGRSVFHCPFCHGWEVRERPLGVLAAGDEAIDEERMKLLRAWSDDVTLHDEVVELIGDGDELTAVRRPDGTTAPCEGLLVPIRLRQRSPLAARLGARAAAPNPMFEDALAVDGMQQTTVAGLFAAGDLAGARPSVANAIASGSNAAASIVRWLVVD